MRGSIHGKSCLSVQVQIRMTRFAPTSLRICKTVTYNRIAHPILSSLGLESAQTEQYRQSYGHFSVMGWLCFWFEVVLALPSGVCNSCGHAGLTGTNRA